MIRVAVPGAAGKMGRMVLDALRERQDMECVAAIERPGHAAVGSEVAPGVRIAGDLAAGLARAQVYIDFSVPEASAAVAEAAAERGVAGVIGTTGAGEDETARIRRAAERIPIVWAPNFSLGVNVLLGLVAQAARALGPDFEAAVLDIHYSAKRDAPSGTALAVGNAIDRDDLQIVALRRGDVVGEHTAYFIGPAERIEISHRAGSRVIFARGAVRAAAWVVGKPPGLYGMKDVLGL